VSWRVRRHRAEVKGLRLALLSGAATLLVILLGAALLPPLRAFWQEPVPPRDPAQVSSVLSGPPERLRIPAINIYAPLVALRLDAKGELEAPKEFHVPGWYADGTPPGDVGPAVIAGHLDSLDGKAVFYRLSELQPGDVIEVERDEQWLTFHVVSAHRYAKNRFPTAEVYGPTPDAQLRLITCGGGFDQVNRTYRDNVVVFAVAA
jgi:LPXTG-site transpeptidase (sortase) family protein